MSVRDLILFRLRVRCYGFSTVSTKIIRRCKISYMANIYVTGVAGFLGSHIANHHLAKGDHVWGMDNFSSSNCTSKHITALKQEKRFSFAMGDISEGLYMRGYKTPVKIDVIYNFACPASPPVYQRMPVETMMTCVLGTKKALDFAREHNA